MSDSSQNQHIPNTIIDLLVSDILQKNGIKLEDSKEKLSDQQKQMIKELVKDLTQQVDKFVNPPSTD